MRNLIGFFILDSSLGSKEENRRYRRKRQEADKAMSDLYHGIGAKDHESFGDFKRRIKKII